MVNKISLKLFLKPNAIKLSDQSKLSNKSFYPFIWLRIFNLRFYNFFILYITVMSTAVKWSMDTSMSEENH